MNAKTNIILKSESEMINLLAQVSSGREDFLFYGKLMSKELSVLRKRFLQKYDSVWSCHNTYDPNYKDVPVKSGVYFFVKLNMVTWQRDMVYVGSSTNLAVRYKAHLIKDKIEKEKDYMFLFYFKEMKKGFYDYEIKLIKALQPELNKQHKNG